MALDPIGQQVLLEESQGLFLHFRQSPGDGTCKGREDEHGRGMKAAKEVLLVEVFTQQAKMFGQIGVNCGTLSNGHLLLMCIPNQLCQGDSKTCYTRKPLQHCLFTLPSLRTWRMGTHPKGVSDFCLPQFYPEREEGGEVKRNILSEIRLALRGSCRKRRQSSSMDVQVQRFLAGCYLRVRTLPFGVAIGKDISACLTQPFHLEVKKSERIWILQDLALFDRGHIADKVGLTLLDHVLRITEEVRRRGWVDGE